MPRKAKTLDVRPAIARDVNAAIRAREALKLRQLGYYYQDIAEMAGYASKGAAWNAIQRELQRTLSEAAEDVRTLELTRLDMLLTVQMKKAMDGNDWAVDRVLHIMERRAALLGLDVQSPNQVQAQVLIREYAVPTLEGI